MTPEDLALVRSAYAAFARRDLAAVLDTLDPDIVLVVSDGVARIGGVHRGHEEVVEHFLCEMPGDPDAFRCEPEEFIEAGDRVLVLGRHRAPSPAGDGDDVVIPFAHVWTLHDGAAVRFEGWSDSVRLSRVLSGQASANSGVVR